jgi:hypothetical protein
LARPSLGPATKPSIEIEMSSTMVLMQQRRSGAAEIDGVCTRGDNFCLRIGARRRKTVRAART